MINTSVLVAISESITASGAFVEAFQFDEAITISEAIGVFQAELDSDNSDFTEGCLKGQEVLIEAFMTQHEERYIIQEAIGSQIFASIKKYWEKMVSYVKGIIAKIKQKVSLMTNDRQQFVSRINEALKNKSSDDSSKFRFKAYKWTSNFISNPEGELKANLGSVVDYLKAEFDEYPQQRDISTEADAKKFKDGMKEKTKEKIIKSIEAKTGKKFTKLHEEYVKSCRNTERSESQFSKLGSPTQLITFIEKSKDVNDTILYAYEEIEEAIKGQIDVIDKAENAWGDKDRSTMADEARGHANTALECFREYSAVSKQVCDHVLTFCNKAAATRRGLVDEAAKEFMSILRSYASYKAPKKA